MIDSARSLARIYRTRDWWSHKLPLVLALFYATFFISHRAVRAGASAASELIVAIAAAAAFVSVLNDLSDRVDDAAAGKLNHMAGRSRAQSAFFIGIPTAIGLTFLVAWRKDLLLAGCYAAIWVAFILYSLPPIRLKIRGLPGVVADAAGAQVFPVLVALFLARRSAASGLDLWWVLSTTIWALAYGIRGMLWHQLLDSQHDAISGTATFAQRITQERATNLVIYGIFPIELAAIASLLLRLGSPWPGIALLVYGVFLVVLAGIFRGRAVIVASQRRWPLLLQDYYELFLPLSILFASSLAHPGDWLILFFQLALFPRRPIRILAKLSSRARRPLPGASR